MRWVAVLGVLLLLVGCGGPTKDQTEAGCQLEAQKFVAIHNADDNYNTQQSTISNMTELCMRSHGYKLDYKACPITLSGSPALGKQFAVCYSS